VGTIAIYNSLQHIKKKAKVLGAHMLEASIEDIVFEDGKVFVKGSPDNAKTIQEIAGAAALGYDLPEGMEPFLDDTSYYDPPNCTYPFGTHICVVEIDAETGKVDVQRYIAVDDVGRVINPMIVDGQVHGGIAQGVAQVLWEGAVYDENGQLTSGSMMDYAVPKASFLPDFELDRTVTLSPVNPLGVKGAGETGTIASTAATINAVVNALSHLGVRHVDMPTTPERIWRILQSAQNGG
jgi:carbon-monoxide dehydrogenase large subunit